jgi:hypothetical protein
MSEMDTNWKILYKIGGVAALIFNRIVGLLRLDALTLLNVPLYYPIFLSIYAALRKNQVGYVTLGTVLALAGLTLFLATPSAFPLVPLSEKYAVATTTAQKEQLLAAGEALLASDMWHSTGAMTGGILMLIAALILSAVMLKSDNFSKGTAYVGILTHGFDLAHSLVSFFAPQVGVILMAIAGPLYLVWFPLLARDFFRLGRRNSS